MSNSTIEQIFPPKASLGQRLRTALTFKKSSELKQYNWAGYLFISPWLIGSRVIRGSVASAECAARHNVSVVRDRLNTVLLLLGNYMRE